MTPTFTHHTTMHQNNIKCDDYVKVSEDHPPGKNSMVEQGLSLTHNVMEKTEPSL